MPKAPPPFHTPLLSQNGRIEVEVWKRFFLQQRTVSALTVADTGRVLLVNQLALVNASGGPVTVLLPKAPSSGESVTVKKVDASANVVTISGNGKLIDGAASKTLTAQWASLTVEGDGAAWPITGKV